MAQEFKPGEIVRLQATIFPDSCFPSGIPRHSTSHTTTAGNPDPLCWFDLTSNLVWIGDLRG